MFSCLSLYLCQTRAPPHCGLISEGRIWIKQLFMLALLALYAWFPNWLIIDGKLYLVIFFGFMIWTNTNFGQSQLQNRYVIGYIQFNWILHQFLSIWSKFKKNFFACGILSFPSPTLVRSLYFVGNNLQSMCFVKLIIM